MTQVTFKKGLCGSVDLSQKSLSERHECHHPAGNGTVAGATSPLVAVVAAAGGCTSVASQRPPSIWGCERDIRFASRRHTQSESADPDWPCFPISATELENNENGPRHMLLELVLFRALPRRDTKGLAKRLLERFGSFAEVINAPEPLLKEPS